MSEMKHKAALLGAAILGGVLVFAADKLLSLDSDEAPIRVKNGSLDLFLLSSMQEWSAVGGSDNYNIPNTKRYKDEFEVTVAPRPGATCGPSATATGTDVVFTYDNNVQIRLQSTGKHTFVKPATGATLSLVSPQQLRYNPAGGFIKQIAVGTGGSPAVLCAFSAANQLDHIVVLNVP